MTIKLKDRAFGDITARDVLTLAFLFNVKDLHEDKAKDGQVIFDLKTFLLHLYVIDNQNNTVFQQALDHLGWGFIEFDNTFTTQERYALFRRFISLCHNINISFIEGNHRYTLVYNYLYGYRIDHVYPTKPTVSLASPLLGSTIRKPIQLDACYTTK